MINPLEEVCYRLCRRALRRHADAHPTYTTVADYAAWRHGSLQRQFTQYFKPSQVRAKRVIDLGCGSGDLSRYVWDLGAASVTGVDLSEKFIEIARHAAAEHNVGPGVSFVVGRPESIPLDRASADVILCFDVMEHLLDYESIIPEWHRVLVQGGKVLISWTLWMHPYGHHCYPMINVPWAHLFLSDAALLRICARTYELPECHASFWHLDGNGHKKNEFARTKTLDDYLNKLTTWRFERVCRRAALRVTRKKVVPFSGESAKTLKRLLASTPFLSEAFCACVVYELEAM